MSSDFHKLNSQERANLRAFWESQAAYLDQITQDDDTPILQEYCWDMTHKGGWACKECWELQKQESK